MGVRKWLEKSAEKQKYKLCKTLNPLSRKAFRAVSFSATKDKSEQALYRLLRFFLQKSEHAHAAAPPFQIEPSALGFDLVLGASLEVAGIYTAAIFQKSTSSVSGLSILIYSRFCLPEKQ